MGWFDVQSESETTKSGRRVHHTKSAVRRRINKWLFRNGGDLGNVVQEFGVEVAHDAEDELLVLIVLFVVGVFVVWVVEAPHFVEVFQAPQTEGEDVLLHQRVDSVGVLDPRVFLFDGEFAALHVGAVDGSSRDLAEGELVDDVLPNRFVDADGDGAHELFESGGVLARFVQKKL